MILEESPSSASWVLELEACLAEAKVKQFIWKQWQRKKPSVIHHEPQLLELFKKSSFTFLSILLSLKFSVSGKAPRSFRCSWALENTFFLLGSSTSFSHLSIKIPFYCNQKENMFVACYKVGHATLSNMIFSKEVPLTLHTKERHTFYLSF